MQFSENSGLLPIYLSLLLNKSQKRAEAYIHKYFIFEAVENKRILVSKLKSLYNEYFHARKKKNFNPVNEFQLLFQLRSEKKNIDVCLDYEVKFF